jgi:hypothetical protein
LSAWRTAIDRERKARQALRDEGLDGGARHEAVRSWWSAVEEVLRFNVEALNAGHAPQPPPSELMTVLRQLADQLAAGIIPDPIRDVAAKGKGRPGAGPMERRDITWAVAYRHACNDDGLLWSGVQVRINDPHPMKTLAGWYGVTRSTVKEWMRKGPISELPAAPGGADDGGEASSLSALLTTLTKNAGARYARLGPSYPANRGRWVNK